MSWVRAPLGTLRERGFKLASFSSHINSLTNRWRFHLAVRIPASHAGYTSSSLVGATILERWVSGWNHRFAKPTNLIRVPRVRISFSPQKTCWLQVFLLLNRDSHSRVAQARSAPFARAKLGTNPFSPQKTCRSLSPSRSRSSCFFCLLPKTKVQ